MSVLLNLGCGTKTAPQAEVVNIDWSIHLRFKSNPFLRSPFLRMFVPVIFRGDHLRRYQALPDNIRAHDLAKGIPYESGSIDFVYHSHTLEHFDRPMAEAFTREIYRVLKPGGVVRSVVPDFERACRLYIDHISKCEENPDEVEQHESFIAGILEQSVRKEASGTSTQRPIRRLIENLLLGDARKRGETHQWMYDKISLPHLLEKVGFREPRLESYRTSRIPDFAAYGFDIDASGNEYKPGSIYVDAIR